MERILLDTNILIAIGEGKPILMHLQEEYPHAQLCFDELSLKELDSLQSTGTGAQKAAARLAAQICKEQDLYMVPQSVEHVDDALLHEAVERGAYLLTLDRALQQRAIAQNVRVLTITKNGLPRPVAR